MSEKINGTIIKTHYYNADNGYTVALFELDYKNTKSIINKKNKIVGNTINIVGYFDRNVVKDEEYILEGTYVVDKTYGPQFKFTKFERKDIHNIHGIISYLSSDLFPGIGKKVAEQVVNKLGIDAITIIKKNPDILNEIKMTSKQRSTIYSGILSDKYNQEALIFFLDNGITVDMANKIIIKLGNECVNIVKENPYILMDKMERFGFKKNDAFALNIGIDKFDPRRLKAMISFLLKDLIYNTGNSYIDSLTLYERIKQYTKEELDKDIYISILNILIEDNIIYMDEAKNIFDYKLRKQELMLASEIVSLLKGTRNKTKKLETFDTSLIEKYYLQIEKESKYTFNLEQQKAIKAAFTEPLIIVTGGPGTGKTTIIHAIIKLYLKLHNDSSAMIDNIAVIAPTGRAAKRLKETTGLETSTIHKFLGYLGGDSFEYNKYNKTEARLIIVDEASMMDLPLAYRLISSMHEDARLIIVGDVNQLPAVGPGQILKDLIDTKEIKTIVLNKIHRQATNSSIINLAHCVNDGYLPENIIEKLSDRSFIPTDNEHLPSMIVDIVDRAIKKGKNIHKDIQVLIPMYKGDVGINEINNKIQELINPLKEDSEELKFMSVSYRINDKVIQLVNRNEKGIMNGDIGVITNFKYKDFKINGLTVLFDNIYIDYNLEEIEDLSLAYAISIHKSQGSEFDLVIVPISTKYYIMLKRKLIYTAITRAKNSLVIIGDAMALKMGVEKIEQGRKTILKEEIIKLLNNNEEVKSVSLFIDDEESAFDTLGERELGTLSISDFED